MNGALIVDGGESAKQIGDDANKNMVTRNLFIDSSQPQRGLLKKCKLKTIPDLREVVWVDFEPNRGDLSHHRQHAGECGLAGVHEFSLAEDGIARFAAEARRSLIGGVLQIAAMTSWQSCIGTPVAPVVITLS